MDLNLPALCPLPLSADLVYDLTLDDLPSPISADAHRSFDEITGPESLFESFELPSYNDIPAIASEERRTDAIDFTESLITDNEPLGRTVEPTLMHDLLEYPEYRFQRLFESRERLGMARTRSSQREAGDGGHPATDPERLMRDISMAGRLVGSFGKDKANKRTVLADALAEKNDVASDYDCNICLEVAKEPVVTCCGHLFCWPCLYQWLHLHCDFKECPVCKGKVDEFNVVPIYGRGNSESNRGKKSDEDGDGEDLKIPPRPQGNRVESSRPSLEASRIDRLRQQLQHPLRALSSVERQHMHRLLASTEGFAADIEAYAVESQRPSPGANNRIDILRRSEVWIAQIQEMQHHHLSARSEIARLQEMERSEGLSAEPEEHRPNRPRTLRTPRREATRNTSIPLENGTTSARQNIHNLHSSIHDLQSSAPEARGTARRVTSTLAEEDLLDPTPSPSQTSISSTMAIIQEGEIDVLDSSLEPERGGTSTVLRRRTRSQSSASSGTNERVPVPRLRQRRRMHLSRANEEG